MLNKKNIKIAAIIMVAIAVILVLINENKKIKKNNVPEMPIFDRSNVEYSRISFFHTKDYMGSLSVPSYWEGNYAYQENGDAIDFVCNENNTKIKLFTIVYSANPINNTNLGKSGHYSAKENNFDDVENEVCKELFIDIKLILETFKETKIK